MKEIGYHDDFKIHPIYTEFTIDKESKMQFFEVKNYTNNPYKKIELWNLQFNIESIGEIIAKKIQYRCEKGNARDLFDIALSIHKQPDILHSININYKKIVLLYETIVNIKNNVNLSNQYIQEIQQMNPSDEYQVIAINTIKYLSEFLDNYINAYNMGLKLDSEEFISIEGIVYNSTCAR